MGQADWGMVLDHSRRRHLGYHQHPFGHLAHRPHLTASPQTPPPLRPPPPRSPSRPSLPSEIAPARECFTLREWKGVIIPAEEHTRCKRHLHLLTESKCWRGSSLPFVSWRLCAVNCWFLRSRLAILYTRLFADYSK